MTRPVDSRAKISSARLAKWAALGFVVWVGSLILTPYPYYVPPDFEFGFLRGKAAFFYSSGYFVGFYLHIAGAPLALLTGAFQSSRTIRNRWPSVHRRIGRLYAVLVLCMAAPGGLVMSLRAYGGWSGTICFALIAIAAWASTLAGWRAARSHAYDAHARWMLRSYVLILSAVFLRLTHFGLLRLELGHQFTYQLAAWLSWLPPLVIVELMLRSRGKRPAGSL